MNITTLNGAAIKSVSSYKYLGFWLDDKLCFKKHINELTKSLKAKLAFFYRNTTCFTQNCRKEIVQSIFLSVLDYGNTMHASAATLKSLDSVYHSALRLINGDSFRTHHCILYQKAGWQSLAVRREKHCILFIYKALLGKLPTYISCLLNYRSLSHYTRSQDYLVLEEHLVSTEVGKLAFTFISNVFWQI